MIMNWNGIKVASNFYLDILVVAVENYLELLRNYWFSSSLS